jgi:hypothetical protein
MRHAISIMKHGTLVNRNVTRRWIGSLIVMLQYETTVSSGDAARSDVADAARSDVAKAGFNLDAGVTGVPPPWLLWTN